MERSYFVVDAFASEPFTGNPAAVLPDAAGLDDRRMAQIAAEFNLSETTFVLPALSDEGGPHDGLSSGGQANAEHARLKCGQATREGRLPTRDAELHVRFRWFSPTMEVAMCGHATVAGVHALMECGRLPAPPDGGSSTAVRIDTRSGMLTAYVERIPGTQGGRMIWLDLIDPTLTPQALDEQELAGSLGLPTEAFERWLPTTQTQDGDVLVFVRDARWVNEAKPEFRRLGVFLTSANLRGLSLATVNTLTPSINVQSRFFAPAAGIDEDPVTGSVHGPLAAFLVKHGVVPLHDGLAGLTCVQGIPGGRTGLLHALVQPQGEDRYGVRIGGRAVTTMRGVLVA